MNDVQVRIWEIVWGSTNCGPSHLDKEEPIIFLRVDCGLGQLVIDYPHVSIILVIV